VAKLETTDLTSVGNPQALINTINNNFAAVETALENTLSRDGTSPNEMESTLDMNSNRIINLPDAVSSQEPVTKAQLDAAVLGDYVVDTGDFITVDDLAGYATDAEVTTALTAYLPKAGGSMTGGIDMNDNTLANAKVTPTGGLKAYTLEEFGQIIYLADYFTGSEQWLNTVTVDNAMTAALAKAQEYSRACIVLPRGRGRLTNSVDLTTTHVPTTFIGEGMGRAATEIIWNQTAAYMFKVGTHDGGNARCDDMQFRHFSILQNGVPTSGGAFWLRNTRRTTIEDISISGMKCFIEMGDPAYDSSCYRLDVNYCYTSWAAASQATCFKVRSGSAIHHRGNIHNGAGVSSSVLHEFLNPVIGGSNIDGYWIEDAENSQFGRYIEVDGTRGPTNFSMKGGIYDRANSNIAVRLRPGGALRNLFFHGVTWQGGNQTDPVLANANVAIQWQNGGGINPSDGTSDPSRAIIRGLRITDNFFFYYGNGAIVMLNSGVRGAVVRGNQFIDCGHASNDGVGTSCIQVGTGNTGVFGGNVADRDQTSTFTTPYTYVIDYNGAATSARVDSGDNISLGTGAAGIITGSPGSGRVDVASATTIALDQHADYFQVTGTTAITTITGGWTGRRVTLMFAGALTFTHGTGTNNIQLAGSVNWTTTSTDHITLIHNGTRWVEISRTVI
jgi:hypothetical protein